MNAITKLNTPAWGNFPTIFTPNLIDKIFHEFNDDWFTVKDAYPYNITQRTDKTGELVDTNITFALAGVAKDAVNVQIEDGSLIVSVTKAERADDADTVTHYLHRGISSRAMKTRFSLYNVDVDNITSTFRDGLLEIKLPSKTKSVKQINID